MPKLLSISIILFICVATGMVADAQAMGLGVYVDSGIGKSDWTGDDDVLEYDFDSDKRKIGLGFVLDTNVARDRLFNYRLQLGMENWQEDTDIGPDLDLKAFVVSNDFGFGLVRTSHVRFWVGPELRIAFASGTLDGVDNFDISLFNFGAGPVLGANIHLGKTMTLAIKTGFLLEGYIGTGKSSTTNNGGFLGPVTSGPATERDIVYRGSSNQFFINFSLMFRINDAF